MLYERCIFNKIYLNLIYKYYWTSKLTIFDFLSLFILFYLIIFILKNILLIYLSVNIFIYLNLFILLLLKKLHFLCKIEQKRGDTRDFFNSFHSHD